MKKQIFAFLTLLATPAAIMSANPFFAMDTIARGKPDVVVPMLKDLGYDGIGGAAGDDGMAKAMEAAGMRFFNGYLTLSFDAAKSPLDARVKGILERMKGHDSALWLALHRVQKDGKALAKSSPEADDIAVAKLQELADYAKECSVRIALYPHTGFWIEQVDDAVRVAGKLNRADVGVTFNLCHWLKVEGSERDPLPVLKTAMPRLMFVTINGADAGDTKTMGWDRLIQPLGSGSYDVAAFMEKVRAAGYTGPIGFQGYGIRRTPREVLTDTMNAWRKLTGKQ